MGERLTNIVARLQTLKTADRDLDHDIAEALGGSLRRVTKLGLNGRTPGSVRVFWPPYDLGKGCAVPYYTRTEETRRKALDRLERARAALREQKDASHG